MTMTTSLCCENSTCTSTLTIQSTTTIGHTITIQSYTALSIQPPAYATGNARYNSSSIVSWSSASLSASSTSGTGSPSSSAISSDSVSSSSSITSAVGSSSSQYSASVSSTSIHNPSPNTGIAAAADNPPGSSILSVNARIGVGVCAGLAMVAIVSGLLALFLARRRSRRVEIRHMTGSDDSGMIQIQNMEGSPEGTLHSLPTEISGWRMGEELPAAGRSLRHLSAGIWRSIQRLSR